MNGIENKSPRISLIARFFKPTHSGVERIAMDVLRYFENTSTFEVEKHECPYRNGFGYILYNVLIRKFKNINSDMNLALNPMESLYLNPEKSIVIVYDLIPLHEGFKFDTAYVKKSPEIWNYNYWIPKLIFIWFFGSTLWTTKYFKKIICICEETRQQYLEFTKCDENKVIVIPCWIQDKYQYMAPNNTKKIKIGTISYLDPRKRVDMLVKLFKNMPDENLELIIGGSGTEFDKIKNLSESDPRIKVIGRVPENQMVEFYKNIDIFVFPSLSEGFGLPIVEALRCGRPVITFTDSNIPEIVKEKTIITSKENFKDTITDLKTYSLREELGKKGSENTKCFDYKIIMQEYEKVLHNVLTGR